MYPKVSVVLLCIYFSQVAYALIEQEIIINVINLYIEYRKVCPKGYKYKVIIEQATPSIQYNRQHALSKDKKEEEQKTEENYCIPLSDD